MCDVCVMSWTRHWVVSLDTQNMVKIAGVGNTVLIILQVRRKRHRVVN